MRPKDLAFAATALAAAIAENKTESEISLLSALFTQIGDVLATLAAARDTD